MGGIVFFVTMIVLFISLYLTRRLIKILKSRKLFGKIVNQTRITFALIAINGGLLYSFGQGAYSFYFHNGDPFHESTRVGQLKYEFIYKQFNAL